MSEYVECYENLKAAVVKLAADDYRRALIRLRRHPKDTNALHTKNECELFFRKGIETYSDMDGEVLIKGIQETHRWNIKSGAVRSGKSYVDTAFVVPFRIRERTGKPGLNVILGVSKESIERNVLQPMREIYTEELIGQINNRNMAMICGEEVYCLGAEKVSQVAKIQGASIKYCYGDEIAKWNKEVFQMLKSRLDKPYSCFDGACNPEHPTHWLKEFLDNDELDIYLQRYTIFDNPFLPQEFVEQLCKEYEGTIYYDRLILGLWKRAEGAIYKRFADNPEKFRCEVLEGPADNPEHKQFRKNDIVSIEIGLDFGGNQSGHSFVARGYTDDYRDVIGMKTVA